MNAKIDISNVILKTDRLILRPFKLEDLDDLYEYARVDGVGQMAGWLPHENKEKSLMILNMFISEKKTFALVYNGKVIGSLGIEEYSEEKLPEFNDKLGREIGYVLSKDYWGLGLMPEAVKEVVSFCFNELKLDFLACGHFLDNNQSKRVQEKCGFKHYKLSKHETRYKMIKDCWISILENTNYINGNNLILRKAMPKDLKPMLNNIWSDENIYKYMFFEPTNSLDEAKDRLNRSIEFQKNNYAYFIALKETNEAIGFCGIKEIEPNVYAETGLCIAQKFQGNGYGKELLIILLDLVFNKINADKFIYACMNNNLKSKNLCLSLGFKYYESKEEIRKYDNYKIVCDYYYLNKCDYKIN